MVGDMSAPATERLSSPIKAVEPSDHDLSENCVDLRSLEMIDDAGLFGAL